MVAAEVSVQSLINFSMANARTGVLPAAIGALAAALALHAVAPFVAIVSVPVSVLGMVLGMHSRNFDALIAGTLAVTVACVTLLASDIFWTALGALGSVVI